MSFYDKKDHTVRQKASKQTKNVYYIALTLKKHNLVEENKTSNEEC